jgi:peptidoglycan/LPS O-acetylase OafA/YrhL
VDAAAETRAIARPKDGLHASYPLFDWLRFALASLVALGHEQIVTVPMAGNFAVQVFFALSGWLIGGILLRTDAGSIPNFFFNRATRIWIPYFVSVAVLYGLAVAKDGWGVRYSEFLFYDVTFTHNWFIDKIPSVTAQMPMNGTGSGFWSICVEEQFYLAAPLVLVLFPWGRNPLLWIVIAAWACLSGGWYGSISLGVLAAVLHLRFGTWHIGWSARAAFLATIGLFAVGVSSSPALYSQIVPYCAVSIVLLLAISGPRSIVGEFFGGMAFPLYLYHWIGIFVANAVVKYLHVTLPSVGWAAYAVSVAVAAAAYVAIDRNVMTRRKGYFTVGRGRMLGIIAYSLLSVGVIGGLSWR